MPISQRQVPPRTGTARVQRTIGSTPEKAWSLLRGVPARAASPCRGGADLGGGHLLPLGVSTRRMGKPVNSSSSLAAGVAE
jgi:hypothetical protein